MPPKRWAPIFAFVLLSSCATVPPGPTDKFIKTAPDYQSIAPKVTKVSLLVDACLARDAVTGDNYYTIDDSKTIEGYILETAKVYLEQKGYQIRHSDTPFVGAVMTSNKTFKVADREGAEIRDIVSPFYASDVSFRDEAHKKAMITLIRATWGSVSQSNQMPPDVFRSARGVKEASTVMAENLDTEYLLVIIGHGVLVPFGKSFAQSMATGMATAILTMGMVGVMVRNVSYIDTYVGLVDVKRGELVWSNSMRFKGGGIDTRDFYSKQWAPSLFFHLPSRSPVIREAGVGAASHKAALAPADARQGKESSPLAEGRYEQSFRGLSDDLRKFENLQQGDLAQDERSAAWVELTKKYPQWTQGVSPGDTDAVRFLALQGGKAEPDSRAAIPKETTRDNLKRVTLRNVPNQNFSENDLYKMIKTHNFFSKSQNAAGHFFNDFADHGDGTVTDRVTGLMWQSEGSSSEVTFSGALEYVQALNTKRFGGHTNWRLPTIEELCSLLEPSQNKRGLHVDEVFGGNVLACWSCDERPVLSTTAAYVAYLGKGDVGVSNSRGGAVGWHFVRAVRAAN